MSEQRGVLMMMGMGVMNLEEKEWLTLRLVRGIAVLGGR